MRLGQKGDPDYQQPTVPLPETWSETSTSATPATSTEPADDLTAWWRRLDDPILDRIIELALADSPDLDTALARIDEAHARRGAAGADLVEDGGLGSFARGDPAQLSGMN